MEKDPNKDRRNNVLVLAGSAVALVTSLAFLSAHEDAPVTQARNPLDLQESGYCVELSPRGIDLSPDAGWENVSAGVMNIKYMTTPEEFQTLTTKELPDFFATKGISVEAPEGVSKSRDAKETLNFLYRELATLPEKIVKAAGLQEIKFYPELRRIDTNLWRTANAARTEGGTLELPDGEVLIGLHRGIANMILDNYCGANQDIIMRQFAIITANAGSEYNSTLRLRPDGRIEDEDGIYDIDSDTERSAFTNAQHKLSSREDVVNTIAEVIGGQTMGDQGSPALNEKMKVVMDLLTQIEPGINDAQKMVNYAAYWGTHGLHPQDMVARVNWANQVTAGITDQKAISRLVERDGPYLHVPVTGVFMKG